MTERKTRHLVAKVVLMLILMMSAAGSLLMARQSGPLNDKLEANGNSQLANPPLNATAENDTNAISNGDFETGDFAGWTTVYDPIIDYNPSQVFNGSHSAMNNHYHDSFYQSLNFTISMYSVFQYAQLATVSVSDADWHEIRLAITAGGLPTVYLHYRIQSTQPSDTATDKYFLVYDMPERWSAVNRPLINDLIEKGITQYAGGKVTDITCQQGGVCCTVYDSLSLTNYDPLSGSVSNAITNGGFEFQNLTEWTLVGTPPYVTIVDYDRNQVYEGFFSAYNHHYYESFYQSLNFTISMYSVFQYAQLATVSVSDADWHEIRLAITAGGLPTVYLHYRIQSTQPSDTPTNKYFLIGTNIERWYVDNRSLQNDLTAKGLSGYLDGKVVEIRCQQGGVCCTVYDALALTSSSSAPPPPPQLPEGIPSGIPTLVALSILGLASFVVLATVVYRSRSSGRSGYSAEPQKPSISLPPRRRCKFCGATSIYVDASFCPNCGSNIAQEPRGAPTPAKSGKTVLAARAKCMVCGSKVDDYAAVLRCPYCRSVGHQTHILEWLHVKDYCPACREHIDEQDLLVE